MIITLTGAKKNVGDFLIGDRATKLLRKYVDKDILNISRFENLESQISLINKSKALILCGGPAYASNIYPGIYPLTSDLNRIKVPIIPFGLGWSGEPFERPEEFEFTPKSVDFLKYIHSTIGFSSCRDVITRNILKRYSLKNVVMTGCPVWYELDFIGKDFAKKKKIKNIVFTTPANPKLIFQTLKLLDITRRIFPESNIYFSFHRGIIPGNGTSIKSGVVYSILALLARRYKVTVVDVSKNLSKINFYDACDLHVGYRVHAHLYFLSKRIPSILINEDGRGVGMVKSLNQPIINFNDPRLEETFERTLTRYMEENFKSFDQTKEIIDNTMSTMIEFLRSIK